VPEVLQHNEGDILRAFDFPAPVFQFLIGVSLVLFLRKRTVGGLTGPRARLTAVRRFLLLIGLGIVLDSAPAVLGILTLSEWPRWGVLQTLGLGGLLATAVSGLPDGAVAALALGLLAFFFRGAPGEVHHYPLAGLTFVPLTLAGLLVGRGLEAGPPERQFVTRAARPPWPASAGARRRSWRASPSTRRSAPRASWRSRRLPRRAPPRHRRPRARRAWPSRLARRRRRNALTRLGAAVPARLLPGMARLLGVEAPPAPARHGGRGRRARALSALSIALGRRASASPSDRASASRCSPLAAQSANKQRTPMSEREHPAPA